MDDVTKLGRDDAISGVLTLATFERDFELRCYHDRVGHIVLAVLLGRVPPHEWNQVGWQVHAAVVIEPEPWTTSSSP